jgi:hypothetical protein
MTGPGPALDVEEAGNPGRSPRPDVRPLSR